MNHIHDLNLDISEAKESKNSNKIISGKLYKVQNGLIVQNKDPQTVI